MPASTSAGSHAPGEGVVAADGGAAEPPPSAATLHAHWSMMGYDERNWYFNPDETILSRTNAAQLTEKWRFTVSGMPLGTPIVAEGKVFVLASGGTYAIDFETGERLWVRDDITGSASIAYADGFVFVQNSLPPQVFKLNARDGTTVWGPIRNCDDDSSCAGESSPIVIGNTVLVGMEANLSEASFNAEDCVGKRGGVRALDVATGDLRWLYHTVPDDNASGENGASIWSTVSVDVSAALVFATAGNSYTVAGPNSDAMHAIDLATGDRRWVHQVREGDAYSVADILADLTVRDLDFGSNPVVATVDGRSVVAAGEKGGTFWVFDRETGEVLWSRDQLSPSHDAVHGGVFISNAFDGRAFYVIANDPASGGAVLHRLDAGDGSSTWSHAFSETTWGAASIANGLVFVPNNATLYVMDADTGEQLTQLDTGGTLGGGAPAVAAGRVVVGSGMLWTDPSTQANDQVICYALPSDSSGPDAASVPGSAASPGAASFSAIYQDVIVDTGCNSGQCHSRAAAGALDMASRDTAYESLVGVTAMGPGNVCAGSGLIRVVPGEPDRSLLVAKLEHTQSCGTPMPNAGTRLPASQVDRVRAWIAAGAHDD